MFEAEIGHEKSAKIVVFVVINLYFCCHICYLSFFYIAIVKTCDKCKNGRLLQKMLVYKDLLICQGVN